MSSGKPSSGMRITPRIIVFDRRVIQTRNLAWNEIGPVLYRVRWRLAMAILALSLILTGAGAVQGLNQLLELLFSTIGIDLGNVFVLAARAVLFVLMALLVADLARCAIGFERVFEHPYVVKTVEASTIVALVIAGVGFVGFLLGAVFLGSVLFSSFGRVPEIVTPFALAGGVLVYRYVRAYNVLGLTLRTNDAGTLVLTSPHHDFLERVQTRITEALLTDADAGLVYNVNVQAQRIEKLDASSNILEVLHSPGAVVAGGDMRASDIDDADAAIPLGADRRTQLADARTTQGTDGEAGGLFDRVRQAAGPALRKRSANAGADRAALDHGVQGHTRDAGQAQTRPVQGGPANTVNVANAPGSVVAGGSISNASIETNVRVEAVQSFDQLMQVIAPRYGDAFAQTAQWLAPVREHLATGRGDPAQVRGIWEAFTRDHLPVLANIASVTDLAMKVARGLTLGI